MTKPRAGHLPLIPASDIAALLAPSGPKTCAVTYSRKAIGKIRNGGAARYKARPARAWAST